MAALISYSVIELSPICELIRDGMWLLFQNVQCWTDLQVLQPYQALKKKKKAVSAEFSLFLGEGSFLLSILTFIGFTW